MLLQNNFQNTLLQLKRQAYDGNYGGNAGYRQPQQGYPQQGYQQQAYGHQPAQQQQYAPQQAAQRPPRQHGHASVSKIETFFMKTHKRLHVVVHVNGFNSKLLKVIRYGFLSNHKN